jgi:tRNA A-37 threonylcarbamoyl transferase component Bud32
MSISVQTVRPEEQAFVRAVAEQIFSAYDGHGRNWHPDPAARIWPVHMADRAGVVGVECAGRRVCAKLFYDRSLKGRLRNWFCCSKAKKAWWCGVELMKRGIPVPAMIGYVANGLGAGLVITELMEDAVRLDIWVEKNGASQTVAEALGRFVRKMHDTGVIHRDLSMRNLLVHSDGSDFLLLDYEDAGFFQNVSKEQRLANLHHLNERAIGMSVPKSGRWNFLSAYLDDEKQVDVWCKELEHLIVKYPSKYTGSYV